MSEAVDPACRQTETEEVRALRMRVERGRTRCLKRAERVIGVDSAMIMLRAARIAAAWRWAAKTEDQLRDVIILLTAMNIATNAAERLEASE